MKYLGLLLLLPMIVLLGSWTKAEDHTKVTVTGSSESTAFALLELFTSQGCSSCPPADAQLARFANRAEEGEAIFALSYHVDYWNYLGWEDPFSDARFSDRQRGYAANLRSRIYTPQLVVNGSAEMIGSRRNETENAVKQALQKSQERGLTFQFDQTASVLNVQYQLRGSLPPKATVVGVIAQKAASSSVKRGENHGRELKHVNVVRAFTQQPLQREQGELQIPVPSTAADLSIVLFIQDGEVGEILAAAKADLPKI